GDGDVDHAREREVRGPAGETGEPVVASRRPRDRAARRNDVRRPAARIARNAEPGIVDRAEAPELRIGDARLPRADLIGGRERRRRIEDREPLAHLPAMAED